MDAASMITDDFGVGLGSLPENSKSFTDQETRSVHSRCRRI
jgi:hypothetical protein